MSKAIKNTKASTKHFLFSPMSLFSLVTLSLIAGAATAWLFDTESGRTRRAKTRDKFIHLSCLARRSGGRRLRDLSNRSRGLVATLRLAFFPNRAESVEDTKLVQRVRSQIGRSIKHPRDLRISARNGSVTLAGRVESNEAERILDEVLRVRGVLNVNDELELTERNETQQPEIAVPSPS